MSEAAAVLDALGNSTRRDIVKLLADTPSSVGEIAARLPISRPAVSQHLRLLEAASLVAFEAQGTRRVYQIDGHGAERGRRFFDELWDNALDRFAALADPPEGQ